MRARRFVHTGLFVLLFVIGAALPSMAQGVGSISGTVTDETGAVLPGANVTLSSAEGTLGGNQETVTDARGAYQFRRLIPGSYKVRGEMQGFRPFEQSNVVVNTDSTARADMKLAIGTLEEGIIVKGDSPLLDTGTALKQTVISRQELEALPNRTDVWSIARVVPGIVMDKVDVGGTERFLQSTPTVRGSNTENKSMIDGMDISSLTGNGTGVVIYLDPYAFEQTSMQLGAGSAENSAGGLNFNMITRSGTNSLHGGGMFDGTTPRLARSRNYSPELRAQLLSGVPAKALAAKPDLEPSADIRLMTDAGAWLGGPIMKDKLWYAVTFHDQRLNRYILGSYNPDGTQVIDDNVMWNASGKVSWQINKNAQLSYFNNTQWKLIGHRGGGLFADGRARQYSYKLPTVNQVKFTTPIRSNVAFDVAYSRFRALDVFGSRPEVKPGDIATMDTTTQVSAVALPTYNANGFIRELIRTNASVVAGSHDMRFGYEFNYNKRPSSIWSTSGLRANFANGVPTSVNTYLVSITTVDASDGPDIPVLYTYREDNSGLYLQDRWTPLQKLSFNLGLRYETQSSFQTKTCRPDTQFYPGACFDEVHAPTFKNFVPRFNLVYDVFGDGRTALKFGANRYTQPISVSVIERLNPLAGGSNSGAVTTISDQRQWLPQSRCNEAGVLGCDRNGDLIPQISELGPAPGYVFLGVNAFYADDVKRPVSNEYTFEFQRQLPQEAVLSTGFVHRETRNNFGLQNTAAPPSSWTGPVSVTEVTSGKTVNVWRRGTANAANLNSNSHDLDTNYNGVDLTLNKRMNNRWSFGGGATFSKVRVKTRGGNRNDPNITSAFDSDVITTGDRPWSYRASGVYELPYQVFVSGTWQFEPGVPESTTVLVTNQTITLPQGNQSVLVAPIGDIRYPNVATLDLNLRKVFKMPRQNHSLSTRLEIFNATNQSTITAWVTQLGPTYHLPSGLQRGRLIKMELAYEF